jgi:PAS domain S-box-containing protein
MGAAEVVGSLWRLHGLRVARLVSLLLVVAYAVTTLPGVRHTTGFSPALDGWLQGTAYVAVAVVALLRPLSIPLHRALWALVGLAVALRATGFVLYLGWVRLQSPPPYPSIADLIWLAMDAVLLLALWVLLRVRTRHRSVGIAFDAVFGALTVAGVAVVLLFRTLDHIRGSDLPDNILVTNLAYPFLDVAMLMMVTGALVTTGLRSWSVVLLTAGIAGFAVVDAVFVYQVTGGTYHPGTPLAALSLAATAAIAFAGWMPESDLPNLPRAEFSRPLLAAAFGFASIAALVYGALRDVTLAGILLPAAALVVGILRGVWTVMRNRGVAETEIEAKHVELLRFQSLVETSDDFVAIAQLDGTVLYLNPAGRRLVGIDPHRDVTSMTIADFLTEEGRRASVEVEQPAVFARGRWTGQSTLRDQRGGPPIPVQISSFLMTDPETGEPLALATVQRDITERLVAQATLQLLADERQRLLDRLVQAQEEERSRIAADVHDDSVQALAAVELRIGLLRRRLADAAPDLQAVATALADTVTLAIGRLRALLFDLETPAVHHDLGTALGLAADALFGDLLRWEITGEVDLDLPQGLRVTAYRIAREAMVNVVKHAHAGRVTIRLGRVDDGVEVVVEDDGDGFDPATIGPRPGHLGIPAMTDRATVAGGRLDVVRRPEGGTRVRLWLPLGAGDVLTEAPTGTVIGTPTSVPDGPEGSA